MNFEKLSQIFTASVNAAVLISVILLIFELRQNQEIAIAQTRNDISRQSNEQAMFMAADDMAAVRVKERNGEELSEIEQYKLEIDKSVKLQLFENIVYQYEKGMYSDEEFDAIKYKLSELPEPIWNYYWANPENYAQSFRDVMIEARDSRENGT